MVTVLFMH